MPKLPPLLFPPAQYYRRIICGDEVDYAMRYDKRMKDTHRYTIADTRGPLSLTVPIEHIWSAGATPSPTPLTWADIPLSCHNQWWDKHRVALESAYGRTPYFEFYIDRFLPLLSADTPERYPSVAHLVKAANAIIEPILMVDYLRSVADAPWSVPTTHNVIHSQVGTHHGASAQPTNHGASMPLRYPQIREDRLGFIPSLSILDLIFNTGPEAPLYL